MYKCALEMTTSRWYIPLNISKELVLALDIVAPENANNYRALRYLRYRYLGR